MKINYPIIAEIARKVYCINEFGIDAMFYIEGDVRGLLVDTGTGTFDIPGLIAGISDKPYDVALTHGHLDHAGGAGYFGKVYLHEADIPMALDISREHRMGFAKSMSELAGGLFDIDIEGIPDFAKPPEFAAIREGHVFDLGSRRVSVYETPGHTPGGLSFLIEDERILLTGDACNMNTLLFPDAECASIACLLETARRIDALSPKYDRNYNGHIGYGAKIDFTPMAETLTRDIIALCEGLISGAIKPEKNEGARFGGMSAIARCKTAQIQFDPDRILL